METNNFFTDREPSRYKLQAPEYYFPSQQSTQALIHAALKGDMEEAKKLVNLGANPNALGAVKPGSSFGFSPLHYALAANNPAGIRVLSAVGANPELKADEMGMPLLFAVMLNNADLLSFLLELKPINQLSPATQQQLLFESARRDAPRCLVLLLERGVPLDIKDTADYTLFLRAFEMMKLDLALWLLQRGAAINFVAGNGATPVKVVHKNLSRSSPGTPDHKILAEIRRLMVERGAVFPTDNPK